MGEADTHHFPPVEEGAPDVDRDVAASVEAFFVLLGRMRGHYLRVCASFDLSPQLGTVVRSLGEASPMRELARRIGMDASNLTGLVDRLEQRGMLERRPDPDDRRVRQLVLTPQGVALRQALNARLMAGAPLVAGLDEEERRLLRALLSRAVASGAGDEEPDQAYLPSGS